LIDLMNDPVDQDASPDRFANAAAVKFGQRARGHVQGQCLAKQMRVWTEVIGEMALDVRQLTIEREQEINGPRLRGGLFRFGEKIERPHPGEGSEPEFEHACPVDACKWWIRGHPARELSDEPIAV